MRSYKISNLYVDTGGSSRENDEFLRWINIPGSGMGNSEGIRSLNFVGKDSNDLPAYIILISHEVKRAGNPWHDEIDITGRKINYWGDAKTHSHKGIDDFKGNKRIKKVWHALATKKDLKKIPPILHFSKPRPGVVFFNGLCVLDDLKVGYFLENGVKVKNYRMELSILDCPEVKIEWLHARALGNISNSPGPLIPQAWTNYIDGLLSIKNQYRILDPIISEVPAAELHPIAISSPDNKLIDLISKMPKAEFEALIEEIIGSFSDVRHSLNSKVATNTGFEFEGWLTLPQPLGYEIDFLGCAIQADKYNVVEFKEILLLVSKMKRGQFAIFFTTSHFSEETKREVREKFRYISLFDGKGILGFLKNKPLLINHLLKNKDV
jgi:hypothetical protein